MSIFDQIYFIGEKNRFFKYIRYPMYKKKKNVKGN